MCSVWMLIAGTIASLLTEHVGFFNYFEPRFKPDSYRADA